MKISPISCKSALSQSRLLGYDYALNPYRGCQHACSYCYAPYVIHEDRLWGEFVDAKEKIPEVLARELRRKKKGVVGISTVTDSYQQVEKRFELTRGCLQELLYYSFPICIQTKSSLVLRDIDLIQEFSQKEVGLTLTTIDDDIRRLIEPQASRVEDRLSALETLADANVHTWAFLGPIMPYITTKDDDIVRLISALKESKIDYLLVDRLNIKKGMWPKLMKFIKKEFPDLEEKYQNLPRNYFEKVKTDILKICDENALRIEFCF
jgi:DNA repair photolyase